MNLCDPDKHYWAQEGPMSVACEDCDAQGVIRLVVHQVPEDNTMFSDLSDVRLSPEYFTPEGGPVSDNKNKAVLRELLDGPQ